MANPSLCPAPADSRCAAATCNAATGVCGIQPLQDGIPCRLFGLSEGTCCGGVCQGGSCGAAPPPCNGNGTCDRFAGEDTSNCPVDCPAPATCGTGAQQPVFNAATSSFTPTAVLPNAAFSLSCDYGQVSPGCTLADLPAGFTCGPGAVYGTQTASRFSCTASPTPGTYTIGCKTDSSFICNSAGGYCSNVSNTLGTMLVIDPWCTNAAFNPFTSQVSPAITGTSSNVTIDCDFGAWKNPGCYDVDTTGGATCGAATQNGTAAHFTCTTTTNLGFHAVTCKASGAAGCFCADRQDVITSGLTVTADECGSPGAVCGKAFTVEDGTPLKDVVIELRNPDGSLRATQRTRAPDGSYLFTGAAGGAFFVNAVVPRTQTYSPARARADNSLPLSSSRRNFVVRGVPATLSFKNAPPAALVVVSTFPFSGPVDTPPPTTRGFKTEMYMTSIDADGSGTVLVPAGQFYYTCWVPTASGAYERLPSLPESNGLPLLPLQTISDLRCGR